MDYYRGGISSIEDLLMVKRIPALDTRLELRENSEVSLIKISVSRTHDSMTGTSLGKSAPWESSHTWG